MRLFPYQHIGKHPQQGLQIFYQLSVLNVPLTYGEEQSGSDRRGRISLYNWPPVSKRQVPNSQTAKEPLSLGLFPLVRMETSPRNHRRYPV